MKVKNTILTKYIKGLKRKKEILKVKFEIIKKDHNALMKQVGMLETK